MLVFDLIDEHGNVARREVALPCDAGRGSSCSLRLQGWRVARRHLRFMARDSGVFLEDFGSLTGTLLNGKRIFRHGPLQVGDDISVAQHQIVIREIKLPPMTAVTEADGLQDDVRRRDSTATMGCAITLPVCASQREGVQTLHAGEPVPPSRQVSADHAQHGKRLHAALLQALDLRRHDIAAMDDNALRLEAMQLLSDLMKTDAQLPADINRQLLCRQVVDEAVGLGPLEDLLNDPQISEIMVNRHDEIYVERHGCLSRHSAIFSSEAAVLGVIDRIVAPIGRRVDESSPMVDARLQDGSRVNAVIAPVALRGASLTIRKFFPHRLSMEDLIHMGTLDEAMARFLQTCVRLRKNLLVAGGTGSGKTTLLNVLSDAIPETERIVTIEDAAELRLHHAHLVSLEARPANLEGRGSISIRDLVRNALRMRPDRIVVGEVRGAEAFDMLAAMNTGHEGSLTTLHANSPRDALSRLETMILMAGMDLPLRAVREHIASSVDIIVQQARQKDGSRRLISISEVTGMESGCIQLQELFHLTSLPTPGFAGCGILPDWLATEQKKEGSCMEGTWFSRFTPIDDGSPQTNIVASNKLG